MRSAEDKVYRVKDLAFAVTKRDIQDISLERLGRELTPGEMSSVCKGVEYGLGEWGEIVQIAIDDLFASGTV